MHWNAKKYFILCGYMSSLYYLAPSSPDLITFGGKTDSAPTPN